MTRRLEGALIGFLLVLACATWMVATEAASAFRSLSETPARLQASVDAAVSDADARVQQIAESADKRTGEVLALVDRKASLALSEITAIRLDANAQLKETRETLNSGMASVKDALIAEVHPVAANLTDVTGHADKAVRDLHPQLLGLVAASKVTAGETAQTMRDVRRAVPGVLVTWDQIGRNVERTTDASAKASEATARTMANMERATRPLPKWVRIPLSITGAVAPTVAGAVSAAAATGAFR